MYKYIYSQTLITRSPLGQKDSSFKTGDLFKEVQFTSNFLTGQEIGDRLIQVTRWADLTVIDLDF